jgi:hypothetical protein
MQVVGQSHSLERSNDEVGAIDLASFESMSRGAWESMVVVMPAFP